MKFIFLFLVIVLNPVFSSEKNQECIHSATAFRCVSFVKNYDGDTVTFNIKDVHPLFGEKISVRVYGIDAPEIKTKNPCEKEKGRAAKNLVTNLLKNAKRVDLENVKRDKYFRILADIKFDQKSLAEILLKNNLATPYFGDTKPKTDWCAPDRDLATDKTKKLKKK